MLLLYRKTEDVYLFVNHSFTSQYLPKSVDFIVMSKHLCVTVLKICLMLLLKFAIIWAFPYFFIFYIWRYCFVYLSNLMPSLFIKNSTQLPRPVSDHPMYSTHLHAIVCLLNAPGFIDTPLLGHLAVLNPSTVIYVH